MSSSAFTLISQSQDQSSNLDRNSFSLDKYVCRWLDTASPLDQLLLYVINVGLRVGGFCWHTQIGRCCMDVTCACGCQDEAMVFSCSSTGPRMLASNRFINFSCACPYSCLRDSKTFLQNTCALIHTCQLSTCGYHFCGQRLILLLVQSLQLRETHFNHIAYVRHEDISRLEQPVEFIDDGFRYIHGRHQLRSAAMQKVVGQMSELFS